MKTNTGVSRRSFLANMGKLAMVAGTSQMFPTMLAGQPSRVLDKSRMIVRFADPLNLETPVSLLNTWITPNDLFYVRCVAEVPKISLPDWRLQLEGEVENRMTLSMEDLKKLPEYSVVATLECSGNGRAFFRPGVEGVQWETGAVGNARWTGVRMSDVLRKAGLRPQGKHVMMDGADGAGSSSKDFVRSIPLEKAMDPDTLLAYEMNGEPLPAQHGYPLRAIVPGWTGNHHVKWLKLLRVMDHEYDGEFMKGYRVPETLVAPGAEIDPSHLKMITSLPLKSLITSPKNGANLKAGLIQITGVAYAGENEVVGVDVSTDLGQSWQPAMLLEEHSRYAWRLWKLDWLVDSVGAYLILSRAKDRSGRSQPMIQAWNPFGYLWNVIDHVRVQIE